MNIDRMGSVASFMCAIHCVLGALLPVLIGALGIQALFSSTSENILSALAITFALLAALVGYRSHRKWSIAAVFILGILFVGVARISEMSEGEHHTHGEAKTLHHELQDETMLHASSEHPFEPSVLLSFLGGLTIVAAHILNQKGISASHSGVQ